MGLRVPFFIPNSNFMLKQLLNLVNYLVNKTRGNWDIL